MNIIGFDPSLNNTGVAIGSIDEDGCISADYIETIRTDKSKLKVRRSDDDFNRVVKISLRINELIETFKPKWGFCELPYGAQSARAGFAFGMVYGLMGSLPIPVTSVTPKEVKAVTGCNKADKEAMVRWAVSKNQHLEWPISNRMNDWQIPHGGGWVLKNAEHMADACAVLHAGSRDKLFNRHNL